MFSCDGLDKLVALAETNPHKAIVMTSLGRLVRDRHAQWRMLENGEV